MLHKRNPMWSHIYVDPAGDWRYIAKVNAESDVITLKLLISNLAVCFLLRWKLMAMKSRTSRPFYNHVNQMQLFVSLINHKSQHLICSTNGFHHNVLRVRYWIPWHFEMVCIFQCITWIFWFGWSTFLIAE